MPRRTAPEGFGRLAAVLASSHEAAPRIEARLVRLTVTTRWVTILAGILFGVLRQVHEQFVPATIALVAFAAIETFRQVGPRPSTPSRLFVFFEVALTVGATMVTGGLASPYVLTPVTGLLLTGYVWGRRAWIGTLIAGVFATGATLLMQGVNSTNPGSAGQIAVVYVLCGALGAFTRNLIGEIQSHQAAAIDQAAEMATANELLVSLHGLAQTLPASFDLPEVVESMRQRLRSLLHFSALVVLVHDDSQSVWTVELAEGVRLSSTVPLDGLPSLSLIHI